MPSAIPVCLNYAHLSTMLCLSLLAACASQPPNEVAASSGGGATAGTGGTGGATANSGAGGLIFTTTATTASTGGNGFDAGPECMSNLSETDMTLTLASGQMVFCDEVGIQDLTGVVVDSGSPTEVWIDTCVPGTGCLPYIARLSVTGPGLAVSVPPGSFARIQYSAQWGFSCSRVAVVTEVDSFGGMVDPMAQGRLWLIVSADQPIQTLDVSTVPFAIHFDKLPGCPGGHTGCSSGQEEPGIYTLRVSDKLDPSAQRTLHMGETSTGFASGGWTFDIHNNRTAYYGGCDEMFSRRYWIKLSGMN